MKTPALLLLALLFSLAAAHPVAPATRPATQPATRPTATQAAKPIPKMQLVTFLGSLPGELRPKDKETARTAADRAKYFDRAAAGKRMIVTVEVTDGGTPLMGKNKATSLVGHVDALPAWLAFDKVSGLGVAVDCRFADDPAMRDIYPGDKAIIEGDFKEAQLTTSGRDGRCTGTVVLVNCKLVSVVAAKRN